MDGQELVKQTLDQIPQANPNAKHIIGLVKEGGRITGYKLSDETFVSKPEAVSMAKQGQIAGVGIAHRGDTEYLKSTWFVISFQNVCRNFILPETGKPCLLFCLIQFAQLIVPYPIPDGTENNNLGNLPSVSPDTQG